MADGFLLPVAAARTLSYSPAPRHTPAPPPPPAHRHRAFPPLPPAGTRYQRGRHTPAPWGAAAVAAAAAAAGLALAASPPHRPQRECTVPPGPAGVAAPRRPVPLRHPRLSRCGGLQRRRGSGTGLGCRRHGRGRGRERPPAGSAREEGGLSAATAAPTYLCTAAGDRALREMSCRITRHSAEYPADYLVIQTGDRNCPIACFPF